MTRIDPAFSAQLAMNCSRFARSAALLAKGDAASVTWRIAGMLDMFGSMRPSEIARRERTSRATTAAVVKRMESEGLITRCVDDADARAFRLTLTDQGRAGLEQWRRTLSEQLTPLLAEVPAEDFAVLQRACALIQELTERMEGLTDTQ